MKILKITKEDDFLGLQERWNGLLSESDIDNIFLTWEWMYHWWQIFKQEKDELFILTGQKGSTISGILPCYRRKGLLKSIHFLGSGIAAPDFLSPIAAREDEVTFLRGVKQYLSENASQWDLFYLEGFAVDNGKAALLKDNLKSKKLKFKILKNYDCPYIPLFYPFEQFEKAKKAHLISNIKRRKRKLARFGETNWEALDHLNGLNLSSALDVVMSLHQKRWETLADRSQNAILSNKLFLRFLRIITEEFYKKQWLSINFLTLNAKPIAADYSFKFKKKVFLYIRGFDPEYKNCGPGSVCLREGLRFYINNDYQILEFLRGDEQYKLEWTDKLRKQQDILVIRMGLKGSLFLLCNNFYDSIKYFLKRKVFLKDD